MEFDKSRVYTALNADELKVGDKVILADNITDLLKLVKFDLNIEELKEVRTISCNARFMGTTLHFLAYLVERKKEKKYRPYESIDELVSDFIKRFNITCPKYAMPFIWLKNKRDGSFRFISSLHADQRVNVAGEFYSLEALFEYYELLDGSPCGKEIEE